jgi:hypothetical protein
MGPKIRRVAFLVVFAFSVVALLWVRAFRPLEREVRPARHDHPAVLLPAGYQPAQGSPLASQLNLASGTPQKDLSVLHDLLAQFTTTFPLGQLPPLGDNEDITAALTGHNRRHLAFLPPDYPLIDAKGRLLDRWGTPYFFHARSAENFDFRSAGPDRQLFTNDDIVRP